MPPTKRSSRRAPSRARKPSSLQKQLKSLQVSLRPLFEMRGLRKKLNRWRHRQRNAPVPRRPSPLLQWFQRWQRRQQSRRQQRPAFNVLALFWPPAVDGLPTRDAVSLLMRRAASALLLLIVVTLVLNAVPVRLGGPQWYLQVLAYIAENVPALILVSLFALLSLHVGTNDAASTAYRTRLLRSSRFGYLLALLLLPVQIGCTAWLYGQAYSNDRTQLTAIRANADALISGARQPGSKAEFLSYLRSRNFTANFEAIESAPLLQVKADFIQTVLTNQKQQEQRLAETTREALLRYSVNALKLFAALAILAGYLRGFYALLKRSTLQRAEASHSDDASLDSPAESVRAD